MFAAEFQGQQGGVGQVPYTVLQFSSCHGSCAYCLEIDWVIGWQRNMEKSSYAFKSGVIGDAEKRKSPGRIGLRKRFYILF